ncbi:MAG: response regulator [Lachnospiraceae bacterium]|nr:response regulator [Lachnospiraceae bacterium]
MIGNILIVAAAEGFIIKGLETKLSDIDVVPKYSSPKMAELSAKCVNVDLVIIYTDGSIGTIPDSLVYIKDFCSGQDKQVIVIGTMEEYEIVSKYIPEKLVFKFYERPLDMGVLTTDVEKYLDAEVQYSRKKSILIVDDDVSYMTMIMDWLKDTYRVSLANSGMEAITWLAKNHADLILLDYEMPITSGPQVLEMIRSSATTANIPVMFLTGKSDKESVMKVLSLKPVGYLLKNVDRKELRDTLAKFFIVT